MRIQFLLSGALLCLLIVNQASAQCLCAEKGQDFCTCGGAIRPVPKHKPRQASSKFPPIGDSCWCGKQLVEPAVPPKPHCKDSLPCNCKCGSNPPLPSCFDAVGPSDHHNHHHHEGVPADPISISLALRAGKACAVPEAKLSYGPARAPLNAIKKIYFSNTPEEKLYALNSHVIELKRRMPKKEEIIEEEEEEEAPADHPHPYLTYHELGYGPERFKNPLFRNCHHHSRPSPVVEKHKPHTCCGFKPGTIALNAKFVEQPMTYEALASECI